MRRLGAGFGAVALISIVIAGCGGGGDDDTTAAAPATVEEPTALSKAELVAQGDAICAEVNAAVGTAGSTSTGSEGQESQVADLYTGMVDRLEGLGAPSDESAGYDEFIGAAEVLSQAQSDVALAAARGEEEALSSAEAAASTALSSFQAAADSFGLTACGEAPAAPVAAGSGEAPVEEAPSGVEEEVAPEEEAAPEEVAPETGGVTEEESAGGGAAAGGTEGGGESGSGGTSGGIGPG